MTTRERDAAADEYRLQQAQDLIDAFMASEGTDLVYDDTLVDDLLTAVNIFVSTARRHDKPVTLDILLGSLCKVAEIIDTQTRAWEQAQAAEEREETGQ